MTEERAAIKWLTDAGSFMLMFKSEDSKNLNTL